MNPLLTLAASLALAAAPACAATPDGHWRTSWYASPQAAWGADFALPTNVPASLNNLTVRETMRISAGGRRVRVVLSNRYGKQTLRIGEVHLARAGAGPAIVPGSDHILSFGGQRSVSVPPGAPVLSDPLELALGDLEQLTVSTYLPQPSALSTFHWGAQQTGYIAAGNVAGAASIKPDSLLSGRAFLSAILVDAAPQSATLVVLGDSISDGNGSTPDRNRRWPDFLAQRLAGQGLAVANAGISGARMLGDRMGENALARFEQDVLAQPGVKSVIVMMGINDIGWPGSAFAPHDAAVTAGELIAAYRQLIGAAHARQVRILGATLTPFEGALQGTPFAGHFSTQKDAVRRAVNQWIRGSGAFDAVLDFDALLRDPQHAARLLPAYDSGDHLHPGDAGYQVMANAVDLLSVLGAEASAKAAHPGAAVEPDFHDTIGGGPVAGYRHRLDQPEQ